jgi:alkylation response protein AidB-like acyl-CoA dehydrogenase
VLLRSAQVTGALASALALTREHTASRKQFGRPLAAFQLVGAHLAEMTAQIALTEAVLQDAVRAHDAGAPQPATASLALTAARAAVQVAKSAHQCHGAIGATREYQLHHYTRRLWAWQAESGGERWWSRCLGDVALGDTTDGVWNATTPQRAGA